MRYGIYDIFCCFRTNEKIIPNNTIYLVAACKRQQAVKFMAKINKLGLINKVDDTKVYNGTIESDSDQGSQNLELFDRDNDRYGYTIYAITMKEIERFNLEEYDSVMYN